jgi:RNA polymerase sigma-70 factor (sigma-E family)
MSDTDESFDQQFDDLARTAYQVSFRILGDREEARDVAQEALARAFARWPRVREKAGGWVAKVAANLSIDHVRRRRPLPDRHPAADTTATSAAVDRADLVRALLTLPKRQREVVVLRYLADLPESVVAEQLGCSTGTVKQHAHRGLSSLRQSVELEVLR